MSKTILIEKEDDDDDFQSRRKQTPKSPLIVQREIEPIPDKSSSSPAIIRTESVIKPVESKKKRPGLELLWRQRQYYAFKDSDGIKQTQPPQQQLHSHRLMQQQQQDLQRLKQQQLQQQTREQKPPQEQPQQQQQTQLPQEQQQLQQQPPQEQPQQQQIKYSRTPKMVRFPEGETIVNKRQGKSAEEKQYYVFEQPDSLHSDRSPYNFEPADNHASSVVSDYTQRGQFHQQQQSSPNDFVIKEHTYTMCADCPQFSIPVPIPKATLQERHEQEGEYTYARDESLLQKVSDRIIATMKSIQDTALSIFGAANKPSRKDEFFSEKNDQIIEKIEVRRIHRVQSGARRYKEKTPIHFAPLCLYCNNDM